MHDTLTEDPGQSSGLSPVDAATAGFAWEPGAVSAAVEQDTWLVSFIDILTLLLTLFVLLLIHQEGSPQPGSGVEPQAAQAPPEQARPPATPMDLTALGSEDTPPQTGAANPAVSDTEADREAERPPESTGEEPAVQPDMPPEAAPAGESAPQSQPADLPTDARPVRPLLLPDRFAALHDPVLPGVIEADPPAPGFMHLLLPAFEVSPGMPAPLPSEAHALGTQPLPPAQLAFSGKTQIEVPPVPVQAGSESGEAPLSEAGPADTLLKAFRSSALRERVEVSVHPGGVNLEISDNILFTPASAALTVSGLALLQELAEALRTQPWPIAVEGHTDNIPIDTARFPSNWELSSARAAIVTRYLIEQGISPERIRAIGYADTRPRADNLTSQGRARNRRVSFVLQIPAA
jgi:chemotaxis protein MotB